MLKTIAQPPGESASWHFFRSIRSFSSDQMVKKWAKRKPSAPFGNGSEKQSTNMQEWPKGYILNGCFVYIVKTSALLRERSIITKKTKCFISYFLFIIFCLIVCSPKRLGRRPDSLQRSGLPALPYIFSPAKCFEFSLVVHFYAAGGPLFVLRRTFNGGAGFFRQCQALR